MHVLWLIRDDLFQRPGGDTTQIVETSNALRCAGVRVDLSGQLGPKLNGYDLVHLFHLDRLWENIPHCRRIRQYGCPAVLSPIWWPVDHFDTCGRVGLTGLLARRLGSRQFQNIRLGQRSAWLWLKHLASDQAATMITASTFATRYLLDTVRVLLPNSRAEQQAIELRFAVQVPAVVVPNGADADFFRPPPQPTHRNGVLCVARIEPRKNQLQLIRALKPMGLDLTLAGRTCHRKYLRHCRREAGSQVRFAGHCNRHEVRALYQRARVHVCPSWYETPGLVNLEAALCGCAVVATPDGSTREYLGQDVIWCRPDDRASIRLAVDTALRRADSGRLLDRIRLRYSWAEAARCTMAAYQQATR